MIFTTIPLCREFHSKLTYVCTLTTFFHSCKEEYNARVTEQSRLNHDRVMNYLDRLSKRQLHELSNSDLQQVCCTVHTRCKIKLRNISSAQCCRIHRPDLLYLPDFLSSFNSCQDKIKQPGNDFKKIKTKTLLWTST